MLKILDLDLRSFEPTRKDYDFKEDRVLRVSRLRWWLRIRHVSDELQLAGVTVACVLRV